MADPVDTHLPPGVEAVLNQLAAYWEEKNGTQPDDRDRADLCRIAALYDEWVSGRLPDHLPGTMLPGILRFGGYPHFAPSIYSPPVTDPPPGVVEFWHTLVELSDAQRYSLLKKKKWKAISDTEESRVVIDRIKREKVRHEFRTWLDGVTAETDENAQIYGLQLQVTKKNVRVLVQSTPHSKFRRFTRRDFEMFYANPMVDARFQHVIRTIINLPMRQGDIELEKAHGFCRQTLLHLLCVPSLHELFADESGESLIWEESRAEWVHSSDENRDIFELRAAGKSLLPIDLFLQGSPSLVILRGHIYECPMLPAEMVPMLEEEGRIVMPRGALLSRGGLRFCKTIGLPFPAEYREHLVQRTWKPTVRLELKRQHSDEFIHLLCTAHVKGDKEATAVFGQGGWERAAATPDQTVFDETWLGEEEMRALVDDVRPTWNPYLGKWQLACRGNAVGRLADWAHSCREVDIEARGELASLLKPACQATLSVQIEESGRDWFDVTAKVTSAADDLTDEEMALLLKGRGQWVRIPKKGWRRMESPDREAWEEPLANLGIALGNDFEVTQRLHALQLAPATASDLIDPSAKSAIRNNLESIRTDVSITVPKAIRANLRPYQQEGLNFLAYLSRNGFGGILADDMGLGKTLQSLAWLAWLYHECEDSLTRPALVVCPKSVIENWLAEAAKFFPGLKTLAVTGDPTAGSLSDFDGPGLIVLNYAQLRTREARLREIEWGAVILDEGQFIKNPSSKTARIAFQLKSRHRLVLTGTPVENRLTDLWSLMNFAMPGVLGNQSAFRTLAGDGSNPLAIRRVGLRLKPFFLRRTKKAVASDLPERIEEDVICQLEGQQRKHYDAELKKARLLLRKVRSATDFQEARFNILTSLLRLRQICCHPALIDGTDPEAAATKPAAKLSALSDLLEPLRSEGEKVLIFSQFTGFLDIIAAQLQSEGSRYFLLTGQSANRPRIIDSFRHAEGHAAFLISLKAGGTGLNLTEAPYVMMLDPWWNPAVENQAIDRTHRIGQSRTVIAYRLLARDTIEQKIRQLQAEKTHLADSIIGEATASSPLTLEDFQFLLGD